MNYAADDPCATVHAAAFAAGLEPEGDSVYRFRFACPVDPSHGRSCTCMIGVEGEARVFCERWCDRDAIVLALGLSASDVAPPAPRQAGDTEFIWTVLSTVEPKALKWLWFPYLPLGKVTIVAGAPGHGKSQLTAMFAAAVTRGAFDLDEPGTAVIVTAEDDMADTVVPRLMAANADLRRVETVNAREEWGRGLIVNGLIKMPGDVDAIHRRLRRNDVRLLIFDPVASFLARTHSALVNQDIRDALAPLKAMAERYETAVVVILHLNKASEVRDWSARIAESHGFQAIARSILALGPDPDDDEGEAGARKVLAMPKANLVKRTGRSLRLEIEETVVYGSRNPAPIPTSRIVLKGLCDVAADDLLMSNTERTTRLDTLDWLVDYLGDEWHPSGEVIAEAIKAGFSQRTIERLRPTYCRREKASGVEHGPWWIALKTTTTPPPSEQGSGGLGGLGGDGTENTANTANTARTQSRNGRSLPDQDRQERQGRQQRQAFDLDEYRRHRDAILGERDEDE